MEAEKKVRVADVLNLLDSVNVAVYQKLEDDRIYFRSADEWKRTCHYIDQFYKRMKRDLSK